MQEQSRDVNNDEDVSPGEPSSSRHVVNMYQCLQAGLETNTEKQPQKPDARYNLRSKGAPPTVGEMEEKVRLLMRKVDPPVVRKQKTQSEPRKTATDMSMFMSSKLKNTPPDNTNISRTPDTRVSPPPLEYNIMDDMKKTHVKFNLFKLAKIQSQRDILLCALGQTTMHNTTSTSKGASTPPGSL